VIDKVAAAEPYSCLQPIHATSSTALDTDGMDVTMPIIAHQA
jgi:hypothetical protein